MLLSKFILALHYCHKTIYEFSILLPYDINFNFSVLGATTTNLPPGVLYRVKATYRYIREDTDELSFESGDIINVVEYEDPEDQVYPHF